MKTIGKHYVILFIMAFGFLVFGTNFKSCHMEQAAENPSPLPTEESVVSVIAETNEVTLQSHTGKFYYDRLSHEEQIWYAEIYTILTNLEKEKGLSVWGKASDVEQRIDKVFQCIMNDYPEFFYVESYTYTLGSYGEEIDRIDFSGTYTMTEAQKETRKELIDAVADECLSGIKANATEYEKVKYVYEYVIHTTEFNEAAMDNQTILSVFLGKQSVCMGYAKAVQYLLNRLGVETTLVLGEVSGGAHAWNLVKVDGAYYYVDATWGDASYYNPNNRETSQRLAKMNYDYLCVTTTELTKTHTIENEVPIPECVSMTANYYVMEGRYFSEYNEAILGQAFEKAYEDGEKTISFKCANQTVYDTFVEELITNNRVFAFMQGMDNRYTYVLDLNTLSMTFWLVNE